MRARGDLGIDRGQRSTSAPLLGLVGALVLLVTALLGLGVWVLGSAHHGCHVRTTRSDAQAIRSSVLLYLGTEPGATCPTMADLLRTHILDGSRKTTDEWHRPFRIACTGDDIRVISDGPDRVPGTRDDLWI